MATTATRASEVILARARDVLPKGVSSGRRALALAEADVDETIAAFAAALEEDSRTH